MLLEFVYCPRQLTFYGLIFDLLIGSFHYQSDRERLHVFSFAVHFYYRFSATTDTKMKPQRAFTPFCSRYIYHTHTHTHTQLVERDAQPTFINTSVFGRPRLVRSSVTWALGSCSCLSFKYVICCYNKLGETKDRLRSCQSGDTNRIFHSLLPTSSTKRILVNHVI